jgi:uncharacterized RDD family membrane protein YckC
MQWTDEFQIETPEQIDLSLEIAGIGSRFVARIVDWGVKFLTLAIMLALGALVAGLFGAAFGIQSLGIGVAAILVVLIFALMLGYEIYFEVRHNGQTPGKKRAGIRVLMDTGAPVDFRASCIRNLLAFADFLPALYFLGSLLVLITKRGQRLGDLAAGTIVTRERAVCAPKELHEEVEGMAAPEILFTSAQLAACHPEGRHILRAFFERQSQMDEFARQTLARRLAKEFMRKASISISPSLDDRQTVPFLAALYRDLERYGQHR